MKYRPELDGLRALAVIAVIVYHFGWTQIDGTAGVTVFFTLSGWLITSLLVAEHERTGRIALGTFYQRRVRRLLPASTLCVILTLAWVWAKGLEPIGRHAVAALTYWANWERYTSHVAYGESGFAPLTHFWSLAVEEQFYLVLPIVAALLLRWGKRWFGSFVAVVCVASFVYSIIVRDNQMAYYDTGARVCELLVGSLLALRPVRTPRYTGTIALGMLIAIMATAHAPHIVVALVTALVLTDLPSVLGMRPLVEIGKVSYGLYLFHPLALLAAPSLPARIALLIGVTLVSAHLLERPIRFHLSWPKARLAVLVLSTAAISTACLGPYDKRSPFVPAAPAPVLAAPIPVVTSSTTSVAENTGVEQSTTIATTTTVPPKIRLSVAGDSTMTHIGAALYAWAQTSPAVEWVIAPEDIQPWTGGPGSPEYGLERPGCGLLGTYPFRWRASDPTGANEMANRGDLDEPYHTCDWRQWVPSALSRMDLDVLVVSYGVSSMWEHQIDGQWHHAGEPEYDSVLASTMDEFERLAAQYGTKVVWIAYPYVSLDGGLIPPGDTSFVAMNDHGVTDAVAGMTLARPCAVDLRPMYLAEPDYSWYYDTDHMTPEAAAKAVVQIAPSVFAC